MTGMGVLERNNVHLSGSGRPMVFVHGFGCDQNMWRLLAPHFVRNHRVVLLDLVGSGNSDLAAYDKRKYATLHGHAQDICEVLEALDLSDAVFVGHSVSAMIGLLASLACPGRFGAQVMVGPSPSYINDGEYVGGFERSDIEQLLDTLEANYLGWSSSMAPAIMGAPDQPELAVELTNSFCRTDPEIARHFAGVTFLSDHRHDLAQLRQPTLILQCSDDLIAPLAVGQYLHKHIADSTLRIIQNVGHCPHLSAPSASLDAIESFLDGL
jgi:sigma-B regulation protein RsbQ